MRIFVIVFILLLSFSSIVSDLEGMEGNYYPSGITITGGLGGFSIKDEYISREKYSGDLPLIAISWAREHSKYVYNLEMEYRNSSEISNHNVSTEILQFSISQKFLYSLKKREFLGKDLYLWLGPSVDTNVLYNKPDIAVSGFDYAQSFAYLIGGSFNAAATLPLNSKFLVESSFNVSLLSFGLRMVDSEEDDESPAKLLTLFTGSNSVLDLGIRYLIYHNISIKISYRSEIFRINEWEPLMAVSDNFTGGITFKF